MNYYCALKFYIGVQGSARKTKLSALVLGLHTQKRFNTQRSILSNSASATVPSAHWFLQKSGFWENKSMNLFATRSGNTHFSFLTQFFFTHQWQDLLCIFMHFIEKLLWHSTQLTHYSHLFTFSHLSTTKKEQYAGKPEVLSECLFYYLRKDLYSTSVASPDAPVSRCYRIHSSNFKTVLMYRNQIIPLLDCYSD